MADPRRPDRVAEAIREQVATFLSEGAKDPRIRGFVTVTAVEMTRDLRHANVFVSVMGDDDATKATLFYDLRQINNFAQITQVTQICTVCVGDSTR